MRYAAPSPAPEKSAHQPLLPMDSGHAQFYAVDRESGREGFRRLPRRTGFRRFLRAAFFAAMTVGLLYTLAMRIPHVRHLIHGHKDHWMSAHFPAEHCVEYAQWAIDPHRHDQPIRGDHFHHFATTSFELPVTSDLLYFVSGGDPAYATGGITFAADGETGSDVAAVEIIARYNHENALHQTKVCTLQPSEDENGVGIFGPDHDDRRRREQQVTFEVKVRLPHRSDGRLYVNKLETQLPFFTQHVGDIKDSVVFGSVSLRGAISTVVAESLFGENIEVKTSLTPIKGSFITSSRLQLHTSNAPIKVEVTLLNENDSADETSVNLRSSNGALEAAISLNSTASSGAGGRFAVDAQTSNSPLKLYFPHAAVDSRLGLAGHTSNSPLHAALHKAYEGSFAISSSSFFTPTVKGETDVEDPAGRGRRRNITVAQVNRGHVNGQASWVPSARDGELGYVKLSTSNSPASLEL